MASCRLCRGAFRLLKLAAILWGCFCGTSRGNDIKLDETVILFPSLGKPVADGGWEIEIQGWIFEKEEDSIQRGSVVRAISLLVGGATNETEKENLDERVRWLLVDSERSKRVSVSLAGKTLELGPTEADGRFSGTLKLSAEEAARGLGQSEDERGLLRSNVVLPPEDSRAFVGEVRLLGDRGVSVVSDLDDTIKVTGVQDTAELLRNTFLRDFRAVEGMAALYRDLARRGASFHYVSASPSQLHVPIARFLSTEKFPPGSIQLKDVRFKDSSILDLLASPRGYKVARIEPLLRSFPGRTFVLVGDTGEKDPEAYGELARRYPEQARLILLRDVSEAGVSPERLRSALRDVPSERWRVFRRPAEISEVAAQVVEAGRPGG